MLTGVTFAQHPGGVPGAEATIETTNTLSAIAEKPAPKWYDKVNVRGYAPARYTRLLETNPDLGCEQCDKSWGDNGGFFLRRVRVIFYGQIIPRVYFYIQPDFAS